MHCPVMLLTVAEKDIQQKRIFINSDIAKSHSTVTFSHAANRFKITIFASFLQQKQTGNNWETEMDAMDKREDDYFANRSPMQ